MKTAGQILKEARSGKFLTVEQLSSITRIDQKYIEAIERDQYHLLPSETVAKGFIRNIAVRLDQNPNDIVAIFRRDFRHPKLSGLQKINHPKKKLSLRYLPPHFLAISLSVLVFVGYLAYQFRAVIKPPVLEVVRPASKSVLTSPFEVEGVSDPSIKISIGDEIFTKTDTSGHFIIRMSHPVGETELKVEAVNRFGRTAEQIIPITVISR